MCSGKEDVHALKDIKNIYKNKAEEEEEDEEENDEEEYRHIEKKKKVVEEKRHIDENIQSDTGWSRQENFFLPFTFQEEGLGGDAVI